MDSKSFTSKQLLIIVGVSLAASALVSYIMVQMLSKDTTGATAGTSSQVSTNPVVTATTTQPAGV